MRFGLFGTGPWAHLAHAPALIAHDQVDFVGVWGRHPDRTAELADKHGVTAYAEVDALLADVDAVAVALPPDVQAPIALRAAWAGKHLLLDKPVAFTAAEAEAIVDAAAERDLASLVFFTRRLMPQVAEFVADARRDGGWLAGRVEHLGSIYAPGNPFGGSPWRRESGGLWDVGPHALSVLLPLLGPVAEVQAMPAPHAGTNALLRHASGAASILSLTLDAPPAATVDEIVVSGGSGLARVPAGRLAPVEVAGLILDEFVAAVAAGSTRHRCDARLGRDVVAVLAAADAAARLGASVRLPTAQA
jgi:predicted dehydrogenase